MTAKEYVKILLAKECMTLKELAALATEKGKRKYTLDGLSHKLGRGTLDFEEFEFFTKLLGYEIVLKRISDDV